MTLHPKTGDVSPDGPYGGDKFVYQQFAGMKTFYGQTLVLGSWYVMDQGPAEIGIREAAQITNNLSRFVPQFFM